MRSRFLITTVFACALVLSPVWGEITWKETTQKAVAPFGKESITVKFPFSVTGEKAVTLSDVRTNCECLVGALPKKIYAPGESGELEAVFTVGERTGRRQSIIIVTTDEEKSPTHQLSFIVTIRKELEFSQRFLRWKAGEKDVEAQSVKLTVHADSKRKIVGVRSEDESFSAQLVPSDDEKSYEITVTPKDLVKRRRGIIYIETDPPVKNPKRFSMFVFVR